MKPLLLTLIAVSIIHANEGNQRAEKIARESDSVNAAYRELHRLVTNIKTEKDIPESLKSASLTLLEGKEQKTFKFLITSRIGSELEITNELSNKLTPYMGGKPALEMSEHNNEQNPLFPKNDLMSFIAAPGSAAGGHHVYPGGLVHHTYTNVLSGLNLFETYEKTYQTKLNQTEKNLGILAALWHDAAKTLVLKWNEDGTLTRKEGKIAGTSCHHIWVLAELAMREMPADFIVSVAGAHDAIMEGQPSEQKVIGYLLAASIISGKSLAQVGLEQKETLKLISSPRLSHYLNNLGDADWTISVTAQKKAFELMGGVKESSSEDRWKRLSLLSKVGEIPVYTAWKIEGEIGVTKLIQKNK